MLIVDKYPYELSAGQRQRVAFARAMAVEPDVVLADEPISMLDVSIRMGILNLMEQLKDDFGIPYLYITHGHRRCWSISHPDEHLRPDVRLFSRIAGRLCRNRLSSLPSIAYDVICTVVSIRRLPQPLTRLQLSPLIET